MRFSVRFNNDLPVERYPELARQAEQAGFDAFWVSDDLFLRSVWVILSAVAQATERIQLGTCIVNPFTQHPSEIAMAAATLDELSGGRALLGLSSGADDFLSWVGLRADRPLTAVSETMTSRAFENLRFIGMGQRLLIERIAGGGMYGPGLGGGQSRSSSRTRRAKASRESRSMSAAG